MSSLTCFFMYGDLYFASVFSFSFNLLMMWYMAMWTNVPLNHFYSFFTWIIFSIHSSKFQYEVGAEIQEVMLSYEVEFNFVSVLRRVVSYFFFFSIFFFEV
jgi:hypothetical protein